MIKRWLVFFFVILPIFSCRNKPDSSFDEAANDSDTTVVSLGPSEISEDAMEEIIHNIASPVEIATLVNRLGVPFSRKYLSSIRSTDNLETSFKQAYKLGIYGADLGYLNIYNKTSSAIDYISTIKNLADEINVGQFFDFQKLKRIATSGNELDSLRFLSVRSFNQMDQYLRENDRNNLSTLIISGLWIEGLYLATQIAKEHPHPEITERIGEQKIVLNDLLLLLNFYQQDPKFAELIRDMESIRDEFEEVTITYEIGEPETIEEDGMLVIVQNETSLVDIKEEQLKSITRKVEEIRNKTIN
ncbi:MAG: hypothetical protein JSV24_10880 [Bacteroidales bacterium]|nr:MAG: hypothetical protein JSV24_10880 [Bacteroidales bacterium]